MTDGAKTQDHHPHGSIGEEAVKLAEAVQDWLGERAGRGASGAWAAATAPDAFDSAECRVCPLCRAMHFVATMQPEVFAHLSDAATSLAAAVRAMGDADARAYTTPGAPSDSDPDHQPSGEE